MSVAADGPTIALTLAPGPDNVRNSEGDFIQTRDGRLLFIYTYFKKGEGYDFDPSELRERVSSDGGKTWSSEERTVVTSAGASKTVMSVSLLRLATGEIALFYAAKNSLADCRPEMRISTDEGRTWGPAVQCITDVVDYFAFNNSRVIQLKSGRIVVPVCLHRTLGSNQNDLWGGEVMCYLSDDQGKSWRRSRTTQKAYDAAGKQLTVQEPAIVELKDGKIMMIIRSNLIGCQLLSYSEDGGETWSSPALSGIKSPLSPASIKRIPKTGDLMMVWNDHRDVPEDFRTAHRGMGRRTPLSVAISRDDGKTWEKSKTLFGDPAGWYCYTAIDFVGDDVLLAHCAGGGKRTNNGLALTDITRFSLEWLYQGQ